MKLAILPALALALAAPAYAEAPKPFEAADLYRISMVTDPQVSPDGRQVIFTRTFFDIATDSRQGEVWIGDVGAKNLNRRLLIGAGTKASGVRWSPDGTRIAYVAPVAGKPQLHVMKLADGIGRPITSGKAAPNGFEWSPDGKSIAFVAQIDSAPVKVNGMPAKPEGATWAAEPRVTTSFRYRQNEAGWLTPGYRHIFVVPADGGEVRQITKGDLNHVEGGAITWTKDGSALIAAANHRPNADMQSREADLWLVPLNGEPRQLTQTEGTEAEPVVSPDGRWVAYTGTTAKQSFYAQEDLWVMPAGGGAARNLTQGFDRPVASPEWADDGKSVYVLYNEEGVTRVAQIPIDGGKPKTVVREVGGTRLYLPSAGGSFSVAKGTIAYNSLFDDRPAGLAVDRGGRTVASVDFNTDWRKGKQLGKLEEIRYKSSADGRDIQGWVLYPPDFDPAKKYPLILDIHGGPNTDYGPMFSITHQLYATAGYIVLFTNPRGSIGYGEEFANFYGKPYPSEDHDDLMTGVNAMTARPYVDANNLFIGGGSGGGVLTLWAIAKEPNKFRAAVALRPVTEWTVQALSSDIQTLTAQYWLGALPWENHELYWRQSPLSLVGNVKTPTMLITGEADYRTPIAQTEMYYQALKMRGIDAMKVRLPEANHGMGRPSQWLQSILMPIDWFNKYRTGAAATVAGK